MPIDRTQDFDGVLETIGDLEVCLTKPETRRELQLQFSTKGKKKTLATDINLEKVADAFIDFSEKIPDGFVFECQSCGNMIAKEKSKPPYKCSCGSRKFNLNKVAYGEETKKIDDVEEVNKLLNDLKLLLFIKDGLQLEVWLGKSKIICEKLVGKGDKLKKTFEEIKDKLEDREDEF